MDLLLDSTDYYTQRNNVVRPMAACMATARVMWYKANKIDFKWDIKMYKQPEDYFMWLLNTPEAVKFCEEKYPWSKGTPPNEVHGMYGSWLDERVTGKRRSDFHVDLTFDDFAKLVLAGKAIMTAGNFPNTKGHAVTVIGYYRDENVLLLADPDGNYHTRYMDAGGYGIRMPEDDFESIVSPKGDQKWGHVPL